MVLIGTLIVEHLMYSWNHGFTLKKKKNANISHFRYSIPSKSHTREKDNILGVQNFH